MTAFSRTVLTVLVLLAAGSGGCRHPLQVITRNKMLFDGPIETKSRIVTETAPVNDGGGVQENPVAGPAACGRARVAVVDVDGLLLNMPFTGPYSLGENPVALFRERLDAVAADPSICAVVIRLNSPGGSVTATDVMWHDLQTFRARTKRPVVVCLMDVAAGGGYYLATAADVIVAHPTTVTGGIGVVLNLYNLRELMAQFNVLSQGIKSGELIDMGSPLRNLPEESKRLLQKMADEYHRRFIQVVREARPQTEPAPGPTYDGRVFTAPEALERRLIDRIGYLDDAVALAAELGQHPDAPPVLFHRGNDPARSLYAVTPNTPLQGTGWPASIPGLDRSRLPAFLYLWQIDTGVERLSGH